MSMQEHIAESGTGSHSSERLIRTRLRQINAAVAQHFGVSLLDLESTRRDKTTALARQAAMWLWRQTTSHSSVFIARRFDRDHSTVLYGISRIDTLMAADPCFESEMRALLLAVLPRESAS